MNISDEMLMKYVDHELTADEQHEIEQQLRADPGLAARAEAMQRLNQSFRRAFDPILDEPVPEHLSRLLADDESKQTADVVDLAARRDAQTKATSLRWPQLAAIAATLVIGVAIGRMGIDSGPPIAADSNNLLAATGPVAAALSGQLSGTASGPVNVVLSYQNLAGNYCRSFLTRQTRPRAGIACRVDEGWRLELLNPAQQSGDADYRQAGTALPPELLRFMESDMQGDPLDAGQEQAALDGNWQ